MRTCTRRVEFDAAHRVTRHESKCRNLHGHRYVVELIAEASALDSKGFVIDFGVLKGVVGAWIDEHLDHGFIGKSSDSALIAFVREQGWKVYVLPGEPTAENIAAHIFVIGNELLAQVSAGVRLAHVRVYETPNCWADYP